MHVDMNERQVWVIDSLAKTNPKGDVVDYFTRIWVQYMVDVLADRRDKTLCKTELNQWLKPAFPKIITKQEGGYNCGVYILMYMFHIIIRKESLISNEDIARFRDKAIFQTVKKLFEVCND